MKWQPIETAPLLHSLSPMITLCIEAKGNEMNTELTKLNKAQRNKLRSLFSGRTAKSVHVDEATSKITIDFGSVTHWLMLGPRGGIVYHEKGAN